MLLSLILASSLSFQPSGFDAMVSWRSGKFYGFSGGYYYRYDCNTGRMDPGYPKYIAGNWPGMPFQTIDSAVNWQNGKAFFFSGAYYCRYDINTDRADPGYPKLISSAWGINWNRIDAALYWSHNKAFFFNNATGTYIRYTLGARAPDPGYPKYINGNWNGYPFPQVDAAVSYNGAGYFTRGGYFGRMRLNTNVVDAGYPKTLSWLPDVIPGAYTPPPASRPPVTRPPPAAPPAANTAKCTINGTLTYNNGAAWQQWNNVTVDLYSGNAYFNGRYNQLIGAGYDNNGAMHQTLNEHNLWQKSTSSVTKPCQYVSNKYGWNYSWYGFVGLAPGVYKVVVNGYPNLTRWVRFTAGGQKLTVALEHK